MPLLPETRIDREGRLSLMLSLGMLVGPFTWLLSLLAMFAIVDHNCSSAGRTGLVSMAVTGLIVTALTALFVVRKRSNERAQHRFLILLALAFCALFAVLHVATALPVFVLHPCD
jgi:hypothetical protein